MQGVGRPPEVLGATLGRVALEGRPSIQTPPVKTEFLKPRLVGERFNGHSIPVEVLKDWAAFEGLVVEAARWLYLEEYPGRKRMPRRFAQNFALHLTRVDNGSAVPVFEYLNPPGTLIPDAFAHWFEKARDRILLTIDAAGRGQSFDNLLPKSLLAYFDQFGRSMRDDERFEFFRGDMQTPVVYDNRVRKTLVLKSAMFYRTEESVRGAMSELNLENLTFTLKLISGEKVVGHFNGELRSAALDALQSYGDSLVMVEGAVVRDHQDNRKRIEQVTRIEPLDPLDVPARLESLGLLRDGWLNGAGLRLPPEGLAWLTKVWTERWPEETPLPHLYPTPTGGVQLEWSFDVCSATFELDLETRQGEFLAVLTSDGEVMQELELDLDDAEAWQALESAVLLCKMRI